MITKDTQQQADTVLGGQVSWSRIKALCALVLIVFAIVLLDQVSKYLARNFLMPGSSITVIPYLFDFTLVYNKGAAFGVLEGKTWYFVIVAFAICVGVICYLLFSPQRRPFAVVTLSMIAAGGIGNIIDRIFGGGAVTDFIATAFMDFPVFNVADISVTCGCILFIIYLLFFSKPKEDVVKDEGGMDAA